MYFIQSKRRRQDINFRRPIFFKSFRRLFGLDFEDEVVISHVFHHTILVSANLNCFNIVPYVLISKCVNQVQQQPKTILLLIGQNTFPCCQKSRKNKNR